MPPRPGSEEDCLMPYLQRGGTVLDLGVAGRADTAGVGFGV